MIHINKAIKILFANWQCSYQYTSAVSTVMIAVKYQYYLGLAVLCHDAISCDKFVNIIQSTTSVSLLLHNVAMKKSVDRYRVAV